MAEKNWYCINEKDVCTHLEADLEKGLDTDEVARRVEKYGRNTLKEAPPRSIFSMIIAQMKEVLVLILLVAAIISGIVGEWEDSIVILLIVILNAVIGVIQENKAENALKALKEMTKPLCKVVRDGTLMQISADEIVPGDLVILEAGDSVPADLRIVESASLMSNESALTGESVPAEKETGVLVSDEEMPLGDQKNMLFMGTTITNGRARALVVDTGMGTQLGRIAQMLQETEYEPTPLQQKLGELGKVLGIAAAIIVAVVFLLGVLRGEEAMEMFMVAIALAVAAVPEGLPAVVTIVLALGVTRMSKKRAIIRKLPAVETLGTATYICSDKTGTLTKNEMTVVQLYSAGKMYQVTGTGYEPVGGFLDGNGTAVDLSVDKNLELMILGGILCNDSQLDQTEKGYRIIGDPTEGALVVTGAKAGFVRKDTSKKYPRLAEIPFDSARKMMTTFNSIDGKIISFTKGAPDIMLGNCTGILTQRGSEPITAESTEKLLQINSDIASQGQRVLALASRDWDSVPESPDTGKVEKDLVFIGFFAMQDPPRDEVAGSVQLCNTAGIKTVMITGDHQQTAVAIARDLGIWKEGDRVVTGVQLERMSDEELGGIALSTTVYARVSPEHKLRIVEALKGHNHVVAMTGDGVNDAPALKRADIGAAMGISGTEVAKEASDMVLQDDNFATIVSAVSEGRTIFSNIRSAIHYLLSCNAGEIVTIFFAILLGLKSPLTAIQILWLNLVTDGPPALALGLEPPQKGIMKRPPRKPGEGVFSGGVGLQILWQGFLVGGMALTAYVLALKWGRTIEEAHTMTFVTLSMCQLVHSYNTRSVDQSLFTLGLFSNRSLNIAFLISAGLLMLVIFSPLRHVFETVILRPSDWVVVGGLSLVPLVVVEIYKFVSNRMKKV